MTIEENKALVTKFLSVMCTDQLEALSNMMHDELQMWSSGGELLPFSGLRDKKQAMELFTMAVETIPEGIHLEPIGMVAEGDKVAVEVKGHAVTPGGKDYNNEYHFLFVVKDGRIIGIKEYHDTLYCKTVICD